MEYLTNFGEKLVKPFQDMDLKHAIRLTMVVGGYWFIRQALSRYMAKRQLEKQVEEDRAKRRAENFEALKTGERQEDDGEVAVSTGSEAKWGWGKKTRKQVKKQEKALQEALENMHAETPDDDRDIADLLED